MDEIAAAQEQLGRALNRARAGEDRALAGRVRDEGDRFVKLLIGALGMARMHALNNRAFDQPIADLGRALSSLLDLLGVVHLLVVEDQVYVNDIRIRLEGSDLGAEFGEKLRSRGVGGFSFHAVLSTDQLRALVALLAQPPESATSRAGMESALGEVGLRSVQVSGVHHFRVAGDEPAAVSEATPALMERGADLLDEVIDNLAADRLPNPLPLRRLVTGMLEAGAADRLLDVDVEDASPYATHTLRVCNLALLLGKALGLNAGALQDLGVAALFHDVGYASGPTAAGGPSAAFEQHPIAGVRMLLRQRGFHEAKIRRLMGTLDHHRRYDDSRGVPTLFGRIVSLAEDFDTLTQPRGGGLSPHLALARMAGAGGTAYDPHLLQIFINRLGRFPPRTQVRLSDGRLARVVSLARSRESFDRPVVSLQSGAAGAGTDSGDTLDLTTVPALGIAAALGPAAVQASPLPLPMPAVARVAAPTAGAAPVPAAPIAAPPRPAPAAPTTWVRSLDLGVLPTVLRDLFLTERTGVLHLSRGQEHRSVDIVRGHVVNGRSSGHEDYLGEVAVRDGLITRQQLSQANAAMQPGREQLGQVLRRLGMLDDVSLGRALAVHAREVLSTAFGWSDGRLQFEERPELASRPAASAQSLSTPDLILEASRRTEDPDVLRYHLGDLGRVLQRAQHPRAAGMPVSLTPLDGFLLSRVDGHSTAREVLELVPGDPSEALRSLFGLLCVGLIEFAPGARPGAAGR